jgi:hypothetical protein
VDVFARGRLADGYEFFSANISEAIVVHHVLGFRRRNPMLANVFHVPVVPPEFHALNYRRKSTEGEKKFIEKVAQPPKMSQLFLAGDPRPEMASKRGRIANPLFVGKAEVGFEPTNNGFAIRPLSPLGYLAVISSGLPHVGEFTWNANLC